MPMPTFTLVFTAAAVGGAEERQDAPVQSVNNDGGTTGLLPPQTKTAHRNEGLRWAEIVNQNREK